MLRIFIHKTQENWHKKVDWRKGGAELIGIGLAMPVICLLLIMIVGIMQAGIMRQSLEYTTYMAARAAVTCETSTEAIEQARTTALMTIADSSFGIDVDAVTVKLQLVGGTSSTSGGASEAWQNGITWEKGALVKCQIDVPFRSLINFQDETMTSIIYMMVERPAKTYY